MKFCVIFFFNSVTEEVYWSLSADNRLDIAEIMLLKFFETTNGTFYHPQLKMYILK